MQVIVGLGNPGADYAQTRHNLGFIALDRLAQQWGLGFKEEKRYRGLWTAGAQGGIKIHLLKPTTYMNNSGQAVRALLDWFRLPPAEVLVIYDEMAIPLGKIRLRKEGSAGGHNGVKSLIEHLGTPNFARLRLGIGQPPANQDTIGYVLGKFRAEEQEIVPFVLDAAVAAVELALKKDLDTAMNFYNAWQAP